jgi:hypothetical protein
MEMFWTFSHVWMDEGFQNKKNIPLLLPEMTCFWPQ